MLKQIKKYIIPVIAIVSCLFFTSCSTKKNTFSRRLYHNVTSHYNVWWNGDQSIKNGDKQLKERLKDDHTQVLRMYNYGTREDGLSMNEPMDRAIQKSSICVQKHSMRFNSREQVKWIDDSYLMMGIANFYKHDYIAARRAFDYVATQYSYNNIKNTANLWLAKTYIETEQYSKAEVLLQSLQIKMSEPGEMPKYVKKNLDYVMADYYIAVKKYNSALSYLRNGMLLNHNRELQIRARFIMGQIYYLENDFNQANKEFKYVIKKSPTYDLMFESQLYLAKSFDAQSSNPNQIKKMFDKMLKDDKNTEYKDKIYYAMAEVEQKLSNETQVVDNLKKSVRYAQANNKQKAMSSLWLANILFDKAEYVPSQAYYDTAMSAIDKDYPGYDSLMNRSTVLTELVENLVAIQLQDSLLHLATIDSVSRNKIIDKVIADYQAEQERTRKEEEIRELNAMANPENAVSAPVPAPSKTNEWYFYSKTALANGNSVFLKKWGRRKLEDNWRISDKQSLGAINSGQEVVFDTEIETDSLEQTPKKEEKVYQPTERGFYLQDIPFGQAQQDSANSTISTSLYNVGLIYKDKLFDFPRSIEALTQLETRYPDNKNEVKSWYALHRIYDEIKDQPKSDTYKYKIIDKYPDTDYAKVILDPEYFAKQAQKQNEASVFYAQTYEAYIQKKYRQVKENVQIAQKQYASDSTLMPQFEFLNAVARGKLEKIDTLGWELYRLVKRYPESPVKEHALALLELVNTKYNLGIDLSEVSASTPKEPKKEYPYKYNADSQHFVIILANSQKVRIDPLKVRLSDFNSKNFRTKKMNVKSILYDKEQTLVNIGNFVNEQEAKDYITTVFINDYVFGGIDTADYKILHISSENYPIFYKNKNITEYQEFIKEYN